MQTQTQAQWDTHTHWSILHPNMADKMKLNSILNSILNSSFLFWVFGCSESREYWDKDRQDQNVCGAENSFDKENFREIAIIL